MKNKNYMMYRYLLCVNDSFDLNFSQAETVLLSIARKKNWQPNLWHKSPIRGIMPSSCLAFFLRFFELVYIVQNLREINTCVQF